MEIITRKDQLGRKVKVGDFICYAIARAYMAFGIVVAEKNNKLKVSKPFWERKYGTRDGRYQLLSEGWGIKNVTLHNAPILVVAIETVITFPERHSQVGDDDAYQWRKLQHQILLTQ